MKEWGREAVQGIKSWKRLSCSWHLYGCAVLKKQGMVLPHQMSSKLLRPPLHLLLFHHVLPNQDYLSMWGLTAECFE